MANRRRASASHEPFVGDRGAGLVALGDPVDVGREAQDLEVAHEDGGAHTQVPVLEP